MMEKYQRPPYNGTLREVGREEGQTILEKFDYYQEMGRIWNKLWFLAADRSGKNL
jgi:hypothetical protein